MARSGDMLDLHAIAPLVVDKHSTGGVGDKTTLVVAPLVASFGLPVGKMSGRGLGFSGGTVDKLESIRGYRADLSTGEFLELLARHGIVVSGQSADLAPADRKFYALRDVTATIESLPLIAASIMSKKIASGTDAIVLDVKVGRGAFMKTEAAALELARYMIEIGEGVGRQVAAVIADMDQPLGNAVGNALEVKEAIETLQGGGPPDFLEHCLTVAGLMLMLGRKASDPDAARAMLGRALADGRAWDKFVEWIGAQGGDVAQVEDPGRLPQARLVETVATPRRGTIALLNAIEVGRACVLLGGGRLKKGDPIDHAVGVVHHAKVGDRLEAGDPLLTIHANDEEKLATARQRLLDAIQWSDRAVTPPPHIRQIITSASGTSNGQPGAVGTGPLKLSIVLSTHPAKFEAVAFKGDFHDNVRRIAELGYDGVELAIRDPELVDPDALIATIQGHGLAVPAIGTGQAWGEEGLSFTDPDPVVRQAAIRRVKSHVPLARRFNQAFGTPGGTAIIIGLLRGLVRPGVSHEQAMAWLVEALQECSAAAEPHGVRLALEPINRYETTLINNVDQGMDLIERVGSPAFGLLLDTFHMNIEEPVMEDSIRRCGARIFHFHVADSNRWPPGSGHLDFARILGVLRRTGYRGYVSGEFMPKPDGDTSARWAVQHLRQVMPA
jgi:pyrimidine-nucleoside phosphorylase